jgi:enamine deaminase RidA (YjgF/YER057c/UK114 family)
VVQSKSLYWHGTELISVHGEGTLGTAPQQLEKLVHDCWAVLAARKLDPADVVFIRLWMRDRNDAAGLAEVRERLLRGTARSASSSFYSHDHFVGDGAVALDMLACRAASPTTRRLVDFTPPRRYAHYLAQDDWLFLSGMAEEGQTMDQQFDRAYAEVEKALELEGMSWRDVMDATMFLEKGRADIDWLKSRFISATKPLPRMTIEYVDGLATPAKNLEIEIIAHKASRA